MLLPLRGLGPAALLQACADARASLDAFARATQSCGSLIQSWVGGVPVVAYEHYPPGGVIDRRTGSQFLYHCHRAADAEHGHLHLFWHATRSGQRRYMAAGQDWRRSAPSHLVSIGLDARGLPVSLFSVNRWVTGGHWFEAGQTMRMLQRFRMQAEAAHVDSCDWLTAFVRLYRPLIARVLAARDRKLRALGGGNLAQALDDRSVEVLSQVRLQWARDLERLERAARECGLQVT